MAGRVLSRMAGARLWDFESLHEKVYFHLRSLGSVVFVKAPFWAAGAASSLGWGRTHTHTTCRNLHKTDFIDVGLLARSVWAPEQGL